MIKTADIQRPAKHLIEGLRGLGAATIAGTLGHMGFRNPHMTGILPQTRGKSICGPALTLQCLPQRPDIFSEGEYADPETQLHRHVLYHVQEGDVVMRDRPNVDKLDLALWLKGWSPNYHVQTDIYPNAVNVTIACGGVTVVPGDIIVADDDGAVVVPVSMAERVIEDGQKHSEWEEFSRTMLMQGAPLQRYYPLHPDAHGEYEAWRKGRG
jgi:regulator of RNase E activity RraA